MPIECFINYTCYITISYTTIYYVCVCLCVEPSAERSSARVLCARDTAAICRRWQETTVSVLHHSVVEGAAGAGAAHCLARLVLWCRFNCRRCFKTPSILCRRMIVSLSLREISTNLFRNFSKKSPRILRELLGVSWSSLGILTECSGNFPRFCAEILPEVSWSSLRIVRVLWEF